MQRETLLKESHAARSCFYSSIWPLLPCARTVAPCGRDETPIDSFEAPGGAGYSQPCRSYAKARAVFWYVRPELLPIHTKGDKHDRETRGFGTNDLCKNGCEHTDVLHAAELETVRGLASSQTPSSQLQDASENPVRPHLRLVLHPSQHEPPPLLRTDLARFRS
jgi:hypothetical protein